MPNDEDNQSKSPESPSTNTSTPQQPQTILPPTTGQNPNTFTNISPHDPSSHKKTSRKLLPVVVIVVLVVLGSSVAAFFTFMRTSPEQRIKEAIVAVYDAKSFASDLTITTGQGFAITAKGLTDIEQSDIQLNIELNVLLQKVGLDMILKQDTAYFKITGLGAFIDSFAGNSSGEATQVFAELEKSYLRIDQETTNELNSLFGGGLPENTSDFTLDEQDMQQLADILKNTSFFEVREELGTQDMDGQQATGYKVVLEAEGLKQLLREIYSMDAYSFLHEQDESFDKELEEMLAEIKQSDLDKLPIDVWIGDKYLRRIAMSSEVEPGVNASLEVNLSRFGEDMVIEAPADSVPLTDALSSFGELMKGLTALTPDTPPPDPTNLQ